MSGVLKRPGASFPGFSFSVIMWFTTAIHGCEVLAGPSQNNEFPLHG